MKTVTSKDGTTIAYDQTGSGPVVILVTGALGARSSDGLAGILPAHFTVIDYDRRGRGDSGDTQPYAVQREVEDIEALIDAVGAPVYLYGMSSGALLALEAASQLENKIKKLELYEPPLILDDSRPPIPADYVEQLDEAIAKGDRGGAVEIFMTKALLIPDEFVAYMRSAPSAPAMESGVKPPDWSAMEKAAHTLAYDGLIVRDVTAGKPLPAGKWASTSAETLVIVGGSSEPFFHDGAKAVAANLPNARYRILEGQDHAVSPAALAPLLIAFFKA